MAFDLQRTAAHAFARAKKQGDIPVALVRDLEVALVHLERAQKMHRELMASLAADECRLLTELERITRWSPHYSTREAQVRARLSALESERRRVAVQHEERTRVLELHLASVLSRLGVLLDES